MQYTLILTGWDSKRKNESVLSLKKLLNLPVNEIKVLLEKIPASCEEHDLKLDLTEEQAQRTIKSQAENGLVLISRKKAGKEEGEKCRGQ